jgi:ELWxxDGT repeat protein
MLPNVVLFEGEDSSGHPQLWQTNGTAAGTIELAGILGISATGLGPVDLTPYDANQVLFGGAGASGLCGLWVTNGTAAGTHELTGIAGEATTGSGLFPSDLTNYNGEIVFSGRGANGLCGLWVTNGTAAGTHELAVAGALATPQGLLLGGLNPSQLTAYNGYVFFSGDDASGRVELWETDGTASGTHELSVAGAATVGQDIGPPGLSPSDLTVFNDQILFSGNDAHSQTGLWETNGTAAGTHELTGIAGAMTTGVGLDPSDFTVYNGEVLFSGIDSNGQYGLWETNGTAAGTHELTGIAGEATTGSGLLPQHLTNYNGELLFTGCDSSGQYGLWQTNGTAAGMHELNNIAGAQTNGVGLYPFNLTVYDDEVLFSGYDSSGRLGLWETNGTGAGTHELSVAGAAATGLHPSDLTTIGADPPVLTAGASVNYVAGAAPVTLDPRLSIRDAESTSLIGATVSIGAGFLPGDALAVGSGQNGIASSYNATTGVLTLSGTASLAAYQTELDSVTFASPNATSPGRTITWSVNDGLTTPTPVSSSLSIVPDPHPPSPPNATPPNFFNSDAKADILWQNTNGDTALWNSDSSGGFIGEDLGVVPTSWQIAGTGAFNGADEASIVWRNSSSGDTVLWNPNGSDGFKGEDLRVVPTSWQIAGTGNFNGAGEGILWRNADGDTALWNSNGSGGFVGEDLGVIPTSWQIAGNGDFSGKGEDSILWRNASGDTVLWNPNGSGGFTGEDLGVVPTSWQIIGTGDFSGNRGDSILWRNASGDTVLWNPNGSGGFTGEDLGVVPTSWQIAGTGNFSGKGDDILWRNANGDTALWNSNGSGGFTGEDLGVVPTSWSVHKIFA